MKRKIYLDCTKLTRGSRWGKRMIPRLRLYCRSRFADFKREMCDEDLFAYMYAKSIGKNPALESVVQRAAHDYTKWVNGDPAPDYLCSWLRTALKDRGHYEHQVGPLLMAA